MFKRLISARHRIDKGNTPAYLVNRQSEETGQVLLNTAGMTEFCSNSIRTTNGALRDRFYTQMTKGTFIRMVRCT
ncbi:MAG: hypothetical protein WAK17_01545 [Candidatus Nitrosopolaris sp.]